MKKTILFIVGAICAFFLVFAPIHEMGHVIMATLAGEYAYITGWAAMEWTSDGVSPLVRFLVAWSGVGTEVAVSGFFYWLFRKLKKPGATAFAAGHGISAYAFASSLTDIQDISQRGAVFWYFGGLILLAYLAMRMSAVNNQGGSGKPVKKTSNQKKQGFKAALKRQMANNEVYTRVLPPLL